MPYRVGDAIFGGWESIEIAPERFADTFIFPLQYNAGLPPCAYGQAIRSLTFPLKKLRRGHSAIWIKLESPEALWFLRELRRSLKGLEIPIAITLGGRKPQIDDFSFIPWTTPEPQTVKPPFVEPVSRRGLDDDELACLHVLACLGDAFTAEISSLTGIESPTRVRACMWKLHDADLVYRVEADNVQFPYWEIRKLGISLALRSWGIPPGFVFIQRKGSHSTPDSYHRRTLRKWPAWLEQAWSPHATVYTGWADVALTNMRVVPDALCWGEMDGKETLFWLEVESGNLSTKKLIDKTVNRLRAATAYTHDLQVNLIFVQLGMKWVGEASLLAFGDLMKPWTAAIVGDWNEFGVLPLPNWGQVEYDRAR
jgi:hypothetical protein